MQVAMRLRQQCHLALRLGSCTHSHYTALNISHPLCILAEVRRGVLDAPCEKKKQGHVTHAASRKLNHTPGSKTTSRHSSLVDSLAIPVPCGLLHRRTSSIASLWYAQMQSNPLSLGARYAYNILYMAAVL